MFYSLGLSILVLQQYSSIESLGIYSLGLSCLGPAILDLNILSAVKSLGVYCLGLLILDLSLHEPVLRKDYREVFNVNVL